ncbi:hypothetical protein QTP88_009774 [Uroleucon formosanum]
MAPETAVTRQDASNVQETTRPRITKRLLTNLQHALICTANFLGCSHYLAQSPLKPVTSTDILDIAIVRLPYPTQIDNLSQLSSDHNPILLETLCTPRSTSTPSTNRFINWTKYKTILTNLPDTPIRLINDKHSIDLAIDCPTKRLQDAIEASVFTPNLRNSSFLLPDYIKLELTEKTDCAGNGRETVTLPSNVNLTPKSH